MLAHKFMTNRRPLSPAGSVAAIILTSALLSALALSGCSKSSDETKPKSVDTTITGEAAPQNTAATASPDAQAEAASAAANAAAAEANVAAAAANAAAAVAAAPSADPYAADKTAERDADASTGQGPNGAATSNGGTAAASGGVTRYACAFAPDLSSNPLPGVSGLSPVVDEPRSCINGRTAYARTKGGGLARVMLSDHDRRLSVMSFSPDRRTFTRQDFILDANRYTTARRDGGDLIAIVCPATGGAGDVFSVQTRLATAHSAMRTALGGVTPARRMTWRCTVT